MLPIIPFLRKDIANCNQGSINGQNNLLAGFIIQSTKRRGLTDGILKTLHSGLLRFPPVERDTLLGQMNQGASERSEITDKNA